MPPRNSKASWSAPPAVNDSRKAADALWLFEQFLNCDPPMVLNVVPISEKTGAKPNTIVKRINTMQHRYPGFGIVTSAKGPKQSSNLAPAAPRVSTSTPAKKSTTKKVEADEEDEDTSEKQPKAKQRVVKGAASKKGKPDQEAQALMDDDDNDQPSNPPISKVSSKAKSQKRRTVKEPSPLSDDSEDKPEEYDVEGEPPARKTATPKTRGGRKSAGKGDIEDMRTDPEKVVPRGRHAVSRQDEVPKEDDVKDEIAEPDTDNAGKQDTPGPPIGTKRKRSETPEPRSSSLTPSSPVRQIPTEAFDVKQSEQSGSDASRSKHYDTYPAVKNHKTHHDPVERDDIDRVSMVENERSSNIQEISQTQPVVVTSQEDDGPKVERPRSCTTKTLHTNPKVSAGLKQNFGEKMMTPPNRNIDNMPSPSSEADDNGEHVSDNDQTMEVLESPTAGRDRPAKPAPDRGNKVTAVSTIAAIESSVSRPKVARNPELLSSLVDNEGEGVGSTRSQLDRVEDASALEVATRLTDRDVSADPDSLVTTNARGPIDAEHDQDKKPERPEAKKWFNKHPEWKIWSPTAKTPK